MEFFCLKCKKKVQVQDENISEEDKGKRRLYRAKCPICATNMAKFGRKS